MPICSGPSSFQSVRLVGEIRAGGIAEGDAEAAVAPLELVGDGDIRRIGEAPQGAQPRVQHLGERLRALDGQRLQGMGAQVFAAILQPLARAPARPRRTSPRAGPRSRRRRRARSRSGTAPRPPLAGKLEARDLVARRVEDPQDVTGPPHPEPPVEARGRATSPWAAASLCRSSTSSRSSSARASPSSRRRPTRPRSPRCLP